MNCILFLMVLMHMMKLPNCFYGGRVFYERP